MNHRHLARIYKLKYKVESSRANKNTIQIICEDLRGKQHTMVVDPCFLSDGYVEVTAFVFPEYITLKFPIDSKYKPFLADESRLLYEVQRKQKTTRKHRGIRP